jgi:hypothetical protein
MRGARVRKALWKNKFWIVVLLVVCHNFVCGNSPSCSNNHLCQKFEEGDMTKTVTADWGRKRFPRLDVFAENVSTNQLF